MDKAYKIFEKIISVLLILSGIFILWMSLDLLFHKLDIVVRSNNNSYSGLSNYYYRYFRDFHLVVLIGILGIISGVLLLKSKKTGWILSAIFFLGFPISVLLRNWLNPESDFHSPSPKTYATIGITVFILLVGFVLLLKPFRIKYKVEPRDINYIFLGIAFVIVDVFVFKK
ncbi:hypothetical protein [Winogradskyella tangerina]|uniref:hypothetical protein n=1 Tax=Winogradskyella tangerina TaxID=2023240 RepID=UPI000DBE803B|nr:hypothetical protein [Winogradskyella tangerina]